MKRLQIAVYACSSVRSWGVLTPTNPLLNTPLLPSVKRAATKTTCTCSARKTARAVGVRGSQPCCMGNYGLAMDSYIIMLLYRTPWFSHGHLYNSIIAYRCPWCSGQETISGNVSSFKAIQLVNMKRGKAAHHTQLDSPFEKAAQ